jgi:hypothetical protein
MPSRPSLQQKLWHPKPNNLQYALFGLREAIRRLNDRVQDRCSRPPDGVLHSALAEVNRALAQIEVLATRPERPEHRTQCSRCQGEGKITQRGVLLQRVDCPDCRGRGKLAPPARPSTAPALPRGHRQRFLLTRLLALGGASWPVPLKRLWGEHNPTAADRAALSRALRDLEDRGLLCRTHAQVRDPSFAVWRCSQVLLTPAGAAMAQTLTLSSKR